MSDLLPHNATPFERAADGATARISDIPVPVRDVWSASECPASLLPWLAWALSVDDWDSSWSVQQKRDTIAVSAATHRVKGTAGAVTRSLGALGINAQVQEWFQQSPPAAPYTYRLHMESEQTPVSQSGIAQVLAVVDNNKSLRSQPSEITVAARTTPSVRAAVATLTGQTITINQTG